MHTLQRGQGHRAPPAPGLCLQQGRCTTTTQARTTLSAPPRETFKEKHTRQRKQRSSDQNSS